MKKVWIDMAPLVASQQDTKVLVEMEVLSEPNAARQIYMRTVAGAMRNTPMWISELWIRPSPEGKERVS